jgi:hypothetical protein
MTDGSFLLRSCIFLFALALSVLFSSCALFLPQSRETLGTAKVSTENPIDRPPQKLIEQAWPRVFQSEKGQIAVHLPQTVAWSDNQIQQRAVISVQSATSTNPTYGQIFITARTQLNQSKKQVELSEVKITQASFPSSPEIAKFILKSSKQNLRPLFQMSSIDQIHTDLALNQAGEDQSRSQFKHSPPKILLSTSPSLLILIDGKPVLRETNENELLRVINTRVLMLFDQARGKYFFYMGDRWMEADTLTGTWTQANHPPSKIDDLKDTLAEQKQVDLLDQPQSKLVKELKKNIIPRVYVSTEPAELLQTDGDPDLKAIPNTQLLYVKNSLNPIFMNTKDQNYYTLLSGRWYQTNSLTGTWRHLPAEQLPSDFTKIPETHPKGEVLASIPGTSQAQQAVYRNEIPQTAWVNREKAHLEIHYDGFPRFKSIQGTRLRYAENTATPVIEINSREYYAVQNGIWFNSISPEGPWTVATHVPQMIYTIPPSSPLYYVRYVQVYNSTDEYVYTGYKPGYLGYYCYNRHIVYGTGYAYPPWIGSYWIGYPVTFGFGFGWGVGNWYFMGPAFYPWWGPWWGWGAYPYFAYPVVVTQPAPAQPNVYQGWSSQAVTSALPSALNQAYLPSTSTNPGTASASPPWETQRFSSWQTTRVRPNNSATSVWVPPPAPLGANLTPWSTSPQTQFGGSIGSSVNSNPPASLSREMDHWGAFRGGSSISVPPPAAVPPPPPPPPPAPPASASSALGGAFGNRP